MKKFLSGLVLSVLFLAGCAAGGSEKERFIDATVESTCLVFESENMFDPALEEQVVAIFKDKGFDVNDETSMNELAAKYQDDVEVNAAVDAALQECAGDFFGDGLEVEGTTVEDTEVDATVEDTTTEEDATTEDEEVTEEDAKTEDTATKDEEVTVE